MTISVFEGYLFLKAPPEKDAKGKAATATWKKRFHRIRLNDAGAPIMECFREADTERSYAVCTFKLADLIAVDGLAEDKYKGKSRFDMVLVSNPKKKKVSMLAENISTRDQWVYQVNKLISSSATSTPPQSPIKAVHHENLSTPPRLAHQGISSPALTIPATPFDDSSSTVRRDLALSQGGGRSPLLNDGVDHPSLPSERHSSSAPRPSSPSHLMIKNLVSPPPNSPPETRGRSELSLSSSPTKALSSSPSINPLVASSTSASPRGRLGRSPRRQDGSEAMEYMSGSEDESAHRGHIPSSQRRGRSNISSQNQVSRSPSPQVKKPVEDKIWGGEVGRLGSSPSRKASSPRRNYEESLVESPINRKEPNLISDPTPPPPPPHPKKTPPASPESPPVPTDSTSRDCSELPSRSHNRSMSPPSVAETKSERKFPSPVERKAKKSSSKRASSSSYKQRPPSPPPQDSTKSNSPSRNRSSPSRPLSLRKSILQRFARSSSSQERDPSPCLSISSEHSDTSQGSMQSSSSQTSYATRVGASRRDKGTPLRGPRNNPSDASSSQTNQAEDDVEEDEASVLAMPIESETSTRSQQRYASPSIDHPGDASRGRGRQREGNNGSTSSRTFTSSPQRQLGSVSSPRNHSPLSKWPNWSRKKRPSSPVGNVSVGDGFMNSSAASPFRMLVSRRNSSRNASPSPARSVASSQGSIASSKSSYRKLSWAPEEDPRLLAEWKKLLGCGEDDIALAVTEKLLSNSGIYDKQTSITNEINKAFNNEVALLAAALDLDVSEHGTDVVECLKTTVEEEDVIGKSNVKMSFVYDKLLRLHENREVKRFVAKKKWLEGPNAEKKNEDIDTQVSRSNATNYATKLALFMVAYGTEELDQPERPNPNTFSRRRKPSPPPPPSKNGDDSEASASAAKTNAPGKSSKQKESKSSKQKKERLMQLNQHLNQHATGSFRENEDSEYSSALYEFFRNNDPAIVASRSIAPVNVTGGILRFKHSNLKCHTIAKHACDVISNAYLCLYGENVVLEENDSEQESDGKDDERSRLERCVRYVSAGLAGSKLGDISMALTRAFVCDELSSNGSLVVAFSAILTALATYISRLRDEDIGEKANGDEGPLVSMTCTDILDKVADLESKWMSIKTLDDLLKSLSTITIHSLPWDPVRRGASLLMMFVDCHDRDENEVLTLEILLKSMLITKSACLGDYVDDIVRSCDPFNDQLPFSKVMKLWKDEKASQKENKEDDSIFLLDLKDYDGWCSLDRCSSTDGYFKPVLLKCGATQRESSLINQVDVEEYQDEDLTEQISTATEDRGEQCLTTQPQSFSSLNQLFANREWKPPEATPQDQKEDRDAVLNKTSNAEIDGELEGFLNSLYDDLDDSRGGREEEEEEEEEEEDIVPTTSKHRFRSALAVDVRARSPSTPPSCESSPHLSPSTPSSPKLSSFTKNSQNIMQVTVKEDEVLELDAQVDQSHIQKEQRHEEVMRGILETDDEIASIMDPDLYESSTLKRMPLPPSTPPPDDDDEDDIESSGEFIRASTSKGGFKHIDPKNKSHSLLDGKPKRMPLPPSTPPPDDDDDDEVGMGVNTSSPLFEKENSVEHDHQINGNKEVFAPLHVDEEREQMKHLTSSIEGLLWTKAEEETLEDARKAAIQIKSSQSHKRPHARKIATDLNGGPPPPPPLPPPRAPSRSSGVVPPVPPSSSPSPPRAPSRSSGVVPPVPPSSSPSPPRALSRSSGVVPPVPPSSSPSPPRAPSRSSGVAPPVPPSSPPRALVMEQSRSFKKEKEWIELDAQLKQALRKANEAAAREQTMERKFDALTLSLQEKEKEWALLQQDENRRTKEQCEQDASEKVEDLHNQIKLLMDCKVQLESKVSTLESNAVEVVSKHAEIQAQLESTICELKQENEELRVDKKELYDKIKSLNELLNQQSCEFENYKQEINKEIEQIKVQAAERSLKEALTKQREEINEDHLEEVLKYKEQYTSMKIKEEAAREYVSSLQKEFTEVATSNKELMISQAEQRELIDSLSKLVEKQNEDLATLKEQRDSDQNLLAEKEANLERLNNDYFSLELKITTQNDSFLQLQQSSSEKEEKYSQEINSLQAEVKLLNDRLQSQQSSNQPAAVTVDKNTAGDESNETQQPYTELSQEGNQKIEKLEEKTDRGNVHGPLPFTGNDQMSTKEIPKSVDNGEVVSPAPMLSKEKKSLSIVQANRLAFEKQAQLNIQSPPPPPPRRNNFSRESSEYRGSASLSPSKYMDNGRERTASEPKVRVRTTPLDDSHWIGNRVSYVQGVQPSTPPVKLNASSEKRDSTPIPPASPSTSENGRGFSGNRANSRNTAAPLPPGPPPGPPPPRSNPNPQTHAERSLVAKASALIRAAEKKALEPPPPPRRSTSIERSIQFSEQEQHLQDEERRKEADAHAAKLAEDKARQVSTSAENNAPVKPSLSDFLKQLPAEKVRAPSPGQSRGRQVR